MKETSAHILIPYMKDQSS